MLLGTPTLLIFENIDTVKYKRNIKTLELDDDTICDLKDQWFK